MSCNEICNAIVSLCSNEIWRHCEGKSTGWIKGDGKSENLDKERSPKNFFLNGGASKRDCENPQVWLRKKGHSSS